MAGMSAAATDVMDVSVNIQEGKEGATLQLQERAKTPRLARDLPNTNTVHSDAFEGDPKHDTAGRVRNSEARYAVHRSRDPSFVVSDVGRTWFCLVRLRRTPCCGSAWGAIGDPEGGS